MLYTNIILTLIFLLLLGIVVGAILVLKIIGKKIKNAPFELPYFETTSLYQKVCLKKRTKVFSF